MREQSIRCGIGAWWKGRGSCLVGFAGRRLGVEGKDGFPLGQMKRSDGKLAGRYCR